VRPRGLGKVLTGEVGRSPTEAREFRVGQVLPGDDVLPGFEAAVAAIFEE
jgi:hypothetical protein